MSNPWDAIHANKGLTISIHLNESEVGNIGGWVNKGFAEPAFADHPWKIVLEEQTRARFDQIAAQFVAAGLCTPPVDTPPPPPPPPSGDILMQGEIYNGDFTRRVFTPGKSIVVWPFRVPSKGLLYGSVAEYGGAPWMRVLTVSTAPGDVSSNTARLYSRGKQATCYLNVGVEATAGELLFFNTVIDEDATDSMTGSGFSIVWVQTL